MGSDENQALQYLLVAVMPLSVFRKQTFLEKNGS